MRLLRFTTIRTCAIALLTSVSLSAQVPRDRPTAPAATGTAAISGRMTVTTPAGPQPVRRARVVLEHDGLKQPQTTDTDTDGRYRFTALPAGNVRVRGEKAGFVLRVSDPRRAFEPPPQVELKAAQAMTIDLTMVPGAALEGRILKPNGDPAPNAIVSAIRMGYDANGRRPTAVRQARTDDLGRFRVHTLPAGEYQVDAAPDPLDASRQMPTPGARPPVLSRTYYPGTARLDEARIVALTMGQTAGNVDFAMGDVAVSTLRGKIQFSDGRPANGPSVRLQRVGGVVGEVRGSTMMESNDFFYTSVPAGEFWMLAVARPAPGADPEFSATRVTVEGRDITNAVVTTGKQPSVSGRVEGAAVSPTTKVVALETAYEWPAMFGEAAWSWTAPVAADGAFTFTAMPGPRVLRVQGLPPGVALKGVFAGDAEVTDTAIEVTPGQTPPALRVVLTSETATVSGVVKDAAGKPVAAARVVVFGANDKVWGARSRFVHAVETGADGTYEIRGVLPGDYHVVAVSYLEALAWTDAGVLRQLANGNTAVPLTATKHTISPVVKR